MKYFKLSHATEPRIIGKAGYPQCKGIPTSLGLDFSWFDKPNSMTNLNNDDFPNFKPDLIFELEDKAFLTDVVSPSNLSANGFLINEKAKKVFEAFNLMEHKYYPATLIYKGEKLKYFWLHFKDNRDYFLKNIDFSNSKFYISDIIYMKESDINIKSYNEYIEKDKSLDMQYIPAEKLVLNPKLMNKKIDLFYISYLFTKYLVSENFKEIINYNKITGLDIREQNIL